MKIKYNNLKYFINIILIFLLIKIIKKINPNKHFIQNDDNKRKRIGIIAYHNDNNIGNQLLKYSMNLFLKNNNFVPTLISLKKIKNANIDFLKKYLNVKEIKNYYTDLNESDFDFLIVNSDQVWAPNYKKILEVGFLSFAINWTIPKIIYAASIAYEHWISSKKLINIIKVLIKQFSAISIREKDSIKMINNYLGIKPDFVLDPTFLIDKKDYLEIIKDYKIDIDIKKDYLCSYILDNSSFKKSYIKKVSDKLKYKIIPIEVGIKNFIEKFIFSINICKSMITDSYHGTVFSIIFNKPFITFINSKRGSVRFFSLNQTFNLKSRFIYPKKLKKIDLDILKKEPNINLTSFNILKEKSAKFLKYNLGLKG